MNKKLEEKIDFTLFETEDERNRWATWALEHLKDENVKFGDSLKQLMTYVIIGNATGFVVMVGQIESPPLLPVLKLGVVSFSTGALFAILAGTFLVYSQWKCLNDYRSRIVRFYQGRMNIAHFNNPPAYFDKLIGFFLALSILAFLIGGCSFGYWVVSQG